jgi:hypothetical protein
VATAQEQLIAIARRKERLSARAQAQRRAIAASFQDLGRPIGVADRVLEAGRFLRAHPVLVAAAATALFVLRGRSLVGLAGRAFSAWRLWRTISAMIGPLLAGR